MRKQLLSFVFAALLIGGCGGDNGGTGGNGGAGGGGSGGAGGGGGGGAGGGGGGGGGGQSGQFSVVVTILLENHDYAEIVGNTTDAPYINSLIGQGGLATKYMDSMVHPSLPNYLYLISGSTQNETSDFDANSKAAYKVDNLGDQLQKAKVPWRSYQEDTTTACNLASSGNYASKHDPFLYFDGVQNGPNMLCANTNVDYASNFAKDLAAGTYKFMWITPNLVNDGHGGPLPIPGLDDPKKDLQASDAWLKTEVPKILDSAIFKAGGVLFITWDEAEGRGSDSKDQVPMIVLSPKLKTAGYQSTASLSHASYLATVEDAFMLPRLGDAAAATTLMDFFK